MTSDSDTAREPWIHWLALAFFGLLGTLRCVVGALYQGWMSSYYPREALSAEIEQQLLHRALWYGGGALAFLVLLVVSAWKAIDRVRRNRSRATRAAHASGDHSVNPPPP